MPSPIALEHVVHVVDRALPFVQLTTDSSPATVWVGDVLAHVRAGRDPLRPWREAFARSQGSELKPHVSAAFVLQWWCEVVATPLAYAAELGSWQLVPSPAGLGFELAPGLYPARIVLRPDEVRVDAVAAQPGHEARELALEAGSAAYTSLVSEVVRHFAPDVKMSSRQRWGVVDDMWATAVRNATGAAGRDAGPVPRRVSCCFIVALPGMRECAACPRTPPDRFTKSAP